MLYFFLDKMIYKHIGIRIVDVKNELFYKGKFFLVFLFFNIFLDKMIYKHIGI